MHDAEDHLLARCKAGDLDAFGIVYERYRILLHRHAYHVLGNQDDASDVLQETFLKAYDGLASFRGDAHLKTWLLTICTNICRTRLRQRERRQEKELGASQADVTEPIQEPGPFETMERSARSQAVRRALQGLPSASRELILLRDIECLSYEEIASILRCSRSSVSVRLFRARRMLRARLECLLEEEDRSC